MIALLKIYKKNIQKDGIAYETAGARPYALYENGELHSLSEEEISTTFVNTGKVFVPSSLHLPQKEEFKFYEIVESSTFDELRFNSCKYTLGREILDLKLFEVIDLDETIENDKYTISKMIRDGLNITYKLSDFVIFRTADDFLIGPIKMEFSDGLYICKETDFIPYYKQQVDITSIVETFENHMRLFCMAQLKNESLVGWIDVASEQRVISYALKQLKENADLGELSRKMIARLKSWYDSDNFQPPHLQERLKHVIRIMENHTLSKEEVAFFSELVLDLDITKKIINQRVQELYQEKYEEFLKINKKLVNENSIQKKNLEDLNKTYINKLSELQSIKKEYLDIKNSMELKIIQLQNDFSSIYTEKLTLSNLPLISSQTSNINVKRGFTDYQSILGDKLSNVNTFNKLLNENLALFKGNDENGTLSATILSAVILGEPIIIYGENSFDLAKCICRTIASEQMLTLIPEIETFMLNELVEQYSNYEAADEVKSLIIHNPQTTSALFSLSTFLKQNKWIDNQLIPDLTIISIDSLDEALPFIEKIPYAPTINSRDFIFRFLNRKNFKSLQSGQLKLNSLNEHIVDQEQLNIRREFREWIEDHQDLDVEIPYQLVEWLNQIKAFVSEKELFQWSYKVFENVIKVNENEEVGVKI